MLIAARNALMAGKRLPYDAEVEYLESTGTQYINAGVKIGLDYRLSITFAPTSSDINQALFGGRESYSAANGYTIWSRTSQTGARCDFTTFSNSYVTISNIVNNTVYTIERNGASVLLDGAAAGSNGTVVSYEPTYDAYVFAVNQQNAAMHNCSAKVYSLKIWDAQGNLVRDFIPVRKGTIGYLYDRVSGKLFGNAGTGDFVLGPDL